MGESVIVGRVVIRREKKEGWREGRKKRVEKGRAETDLGDKNGEEK